MSAKSHAIPELDAAGLRRFALTTGGIVVVLFGLLAPWLLERPIPRWPWVLGAVLVVWGSAAPRSLRFVYRGWMRFGLVMSRITTPIIMGLAFALAVTPVSLIRGLFGRDSMARRMDAQAQSYRIESVKTSDKSMERPF